MSVVSAGTIIFCEGKPNGLDDSLLQSLNLPANVLIKPSGGKRSLAVYAQVELAKYDSDKPSYLTFRDRDFDAKPPDRIQLIRPFGNKKPVFYTYFACIENYLLDAQVMNAYWQEFDSTALRWNYGPSPGIAALADWIEAGAREIAEYQAVRWALASLKPGLRWPEVSNHWTKDGDGDLPGNLDFEACLEAGRSLIREFHLNITHINFWRFEDQAQTYHKQFTDSVFWSNKAYLVWFHGKDLRKAMQRQQPRWISLDRYFEWAASRIDWSQHPDLKELRNLILNPPKSPLERKT